MSDNSLTVHATCVSVAGKGVLITGPSGSGKSALALQLIALGADLVADDRTVICRQDQHLVASPPSTIAGLIEARGIGIIPLPSLAWAKLVLAVDMSCIETMRLPEPRSITLLDIELPCLHKVDAPYFPAAIRAYLNRTSNEAT